MKIPTWCPGCGDYMILAAIRKSLQELKIPSKDVLIVSGIGCGSKMPHYVKAYGFEGIHGRALPVATGAKLANNKLHIIVVAGDGDAYGIGGNHFLHSCRRNINLTYITQDNSVYGLTRGQTSPTSPQGMKTNSTPFGALEQPVNPLTLAITQGATFVSQGASYNLKLADTIKQAIKHKGFSLVNVLQLCPSFNKHNDIQWFNKNTKQIKTQKNKYKAIEIAESSKLPLGVLYQIKRKTYDEQEPQISKTPLVKQSLKVNINKMLNDFI
ncbi:2-oxoacid:ferredoxin oxidoreductase subunit beta [Candidatus Woesearchaeota archaeon]|jgi:2-oxoglutarate/2-oxoacid ferredoxin oxidoreductase subunit beta|nr:2-oxoacid:ferredoxin oxidoreductase subunit beta [Candidatus Woesearchaeota archaeon]MBT7062778.1 2-oxoacid:ferredoxin oxidoreductase subunit beta [Candidatus Woesearchaeota archaeon]MBT7402422.1 2-oxoacid:ferredoxin oxidoreductase subunit beta [Candidatus Woesearchaeota archaeon]